MWTFNFREAEKRFKSFQEIVEQKVFVYFYLDLIRKLTEDTDVFWGREGLILVILPFVVKMGFNRLLKYGIDLLLVVEFSDGAKKL